MAADDLDVAELMDAIEQVTAIYRKPLPRPLGRQGFTFRDALRTERPEFGREQELG